MQKAFFWMLLAVFISACNCGLNVPPSVEDVDAGLLADAGGQMVQCEADSDCAIGCKGSSAYRCLEGVCFCDVCPKLTRQGAVEKLYALMRLDQCYKTNCTDVGIYPETCSWGALENAGVIGPTASGKCRPNDVITRAELIKLVISAVDGLPDYEAPTAPTFADVATNMWYYDYVEAAVQFGFIDRDSNFFPVDGADECWADRVFERAALIVAWAETVHPGGIVVAGASETLSVRVRVYNTSAKKPLKTLTIVNDLEGGFDQATHTLGVAKIWVSCSPPSGSGTYLNFGGILVGGKAVFSNLNCYDESGTGLVVQVAFDASFMSAVGESLSGARVRLGILESSMRVYGQDQINLFVIRKSAPEIVKMPGLSTILVNGENRLYGLTVTANNAGAISFGRLTFQVDSAIPLAGFRFYRGSTLLSPSAVNIFSETADLGSASGNSLTGNLIGVSFNQEEVVAAGTSQSYTLAATATGVLVGSSVVTRLLGDDDRLLQIASPTYNPVTGRIHATDGSALFSNSAGLTQAKPAEGIRIVWSDQSADAHSYPTVANGLVVADSGSCDWTNGWGLGVESLSSHTLTQ